MGCWSVAFGYRKTGRGCGLAVLQICGGLLGFRAVVNLLAQVNFKVLECVCKCSCKGGMCVTVDGAYMLMCAAICPSLN